MSDGAWRIPRLRTIDEGLAGEVVMAATARLTALHSRPAPVDSATAIHYKMQYSTTARRLDGSTGRGEPSMSPMKKSAGTSMNRPELSKERPEASKKWTEASKKWTKTLKKRDRALKEWDGPCSSRESRHRADFVAGFPIGPWESGPGTPRKVAPILQRPLPRRLRRPLPMSRRGPSRGLARAAAPSSPSRASTTDASGPHWRRCAPRGRL